MIGILNQSTVVKEYEFIKTAIDELDYVLENVNKTLRKRCFHTFEYTLDSDNKLTKTSTHENVNITITHRSIEYKNDFWGLSKKNQQCSKK